jgi:multidrug efflux pump subunit AcrA (membrane-fusion protein)
LHRVWSAPLLPESALQADAHGSYVYVVTPANKAERRGVTIGRSPIMA